MIIDCHCHAGKGDLMTAPWNTDAPIEPYLRRAHAAGIDKTVVFAPFHSDYAVANAQVARIVARLLSARSAAGSVVICDGVYPSTGRAAALRAIERVARAAGALVYVDDAHGIGLMGAHPSVAMPYGHGGGGTSAHLGIAPGHVVHVGSLSKALGVPVAFVAGPAEPIAHLRVAAPTYTRCSPPALPVLGALRVHARDGEALRQRLAGLIRRFQRGLHQLGRAPQTGTLFPIQTLLFPTPLAAQAVARALRRQGIWAILQIGSNEHSGGGGLRFALTALHTPADIDLLVEALARHVAPIVAQADGSALSTHDTGSH